jgi:hypothetical protein
VIAPPSPNQFNEWPVPTAGFAHDLGPAMSQTSARSPDDADDEIEAGVGFQRPHNGRDFADDTDDGVGDERNHL